AQVVAQKQIEEVVVIGGRRVRKLASVTGRRGIFRAKARDRVKDIVGGKTRAFARQSNRDAQLEKAQTLRGSHAPQFLGRFAVKRRFRIEKNAQQPRLIFAVECVERELNAIGEKLFELCFDR